MLKDDYGWFVEILEREFGDSFGGAQEFDYGRGYGGAVRIGDRRYPVYAEIDEGWYGRAGVSLNAESDPQAALAELIRPLKEKRATHLEGET